MNSNLTIELFGHVLVIISILLCQKKIREDGVELLPLGVETYEGAAGTFRGVEKLHGAGTCFL